MTADGSKERTKEQTKERSKAFDLALGQLEKQFGKGSIIRLGDGRAVQDLAVIPTGSLGLDLALGLGGLPRGRVIEIFGPESSGKTTLTLSVIAEAQKLGGNAVFIDAEHALQPSYAKLLGVDIDNLYVSQPDTGEEALEIADQLVRSGAVDIVVIDSVAALVPRAEIEGEMGDSHVGLQARLMSQALRKLTGSISKSQCMVIFINQIRMKIGVMFGNPETTSGGNALKFYASVRLDIRRTGSIKEGEEVTGSRTKVRVVKNKVAAPFRAAEFDIMYKEGISHNGELIDLGIDAGLVQKSGTWLSYGDQRLGQGRENARQTLKENPEMARQLEGQIRASAGLPMLAAPAGAAAAATAEAGGADARGADGKKSKGDTSGSRWKAGDETISSTLVAAGESVEDGAETASAVRERRGGPKKS